MILLKSRSELDLMRESGRKLAAILERIKGIIKPGVTTGEIDSLAEELIRQEKAIPAFKGYRGYPAATCTSVNEVVVHGIPGSLKLKDGDIISIDLGLEYKDYFSDAAFTVGVGKIDSKAKKLIEVTRDSLNEGIKAAKPANRLGDISHAVQKYVEKNGFSVVRQFVGHGVGRNLHEEPEVPNFGRKGWGEILKPGMVLAIEPMVNMGTWECEVLEDGWTAVTSDKKLSAHFEHTVAIMEDGPEILTKL
ncbi:MAG: type I methionyl aminopeptidase [Candidatus Omnitrophica bacterium]|nr:type I methionyl aminopeptidase [Candidatus Omnitrophota bacterium]